ncbi:MAG: PfkB family carbohydrate kinase [Candidatus Ratteibacteria bacterium]|nr:PfkB family carbohydrate kinase [Candidatus Ratteibacteria bacterium]
MIKRLLGILGEIKGKTILVWGDIVCDEYIYGDVSRISREAPVLILKKSGGEYRPGGAANAANNLASLGAKVKIMGIAGDDEQGRRLIALLKKKGIDTSGIRINKKFSTITKTRIMAGGIDRPKQQVIRIDSGDKLKTYPDELQDNFWKYFLSTADSMDAVLISDYSYGAVNSKTYDKISQKLSKENIPLIVDSRFDLRKFKNATVLTPNEEEAANALGMDPKDINNIAKRILHELNPKILILTRGKKGMDVFIENKKPLHIPIHGTDEVIDVTGAGDTVASVVALALSCGADGYDAARLANYAASIVVMKMGASTVTIKELKEVLHG